VNVKGKGVQGSSGSKLKKTTTRKKAVGNPNPGSSAPKRGKKNPLEPICKDWTRLSQEEFIVARMHFNPYSFPATASDERFHCKMYHEMYEFVYGRLAHPIVRQQPLDVDFIRKHMPKAMDMCEHHDLVKLMTLKKDYSDELILQFFSTVHFHSDEARSMTWMSGTSHYTRTLADFGALLGYDVQDPADSNYLRIHNAKQPFSHDPHLYVCYHEGDGPLYSPYITHMTNTYHTIHKILRNTLSSPSNKGIKVWFAVG
jgi:hypothetical protein